MSIWRMMYESGGLLRKCARGLSYVRPLLLRRESDPEQGELLLHLRNGRLMMGTRDTLYSWEDRYMNFVWALEKVDFSTMPMPRILLLGLGLGSIPYILEKKYKQNFVMDAVDIHPVAVAWARQYTLYGLSTSVTSYVSDGISFVQNALVESRAYDMVIVDVCVEDRIPVDMEQRVFLESLFSLMSVGGLLLFNRFYSTYGDQFRTERFIKKSVKPVFSETECWDYQGTAIVVGRK